MHCTTGGSATGGSATGGSATGGSATGGSATGGSAGAAELGLREACFSTMLLYSSVKSSRGSMPDVMAWGYCSASTKRSNCNRLSRMLAMFSSRFFNASFICSGVIES